MQSAGRPVKMPSVAVNTRTYRMANELAGQRLDTILARYREQDLAPDAIVSRLFADYRIEVSRPTVVAWIDNLPTPEPEQAAS